MPSSPSVAPLFIVLNARSGHADAAAERLIIEQVLREAGREHHILMAQRGSELPACSRQAVTAARAHGGAVVAAGGDGTIGTVAQAVLGSGCPFGVLPQGTFNYFVRTHGIPADTAEATRALLDARVEPVQVGLVNDRAFLVNASVGLYPVMLENREAYKRRYGRSRMVALWAALVTLAHAHRPLHLWLESRERAQEVRTATLFVGNNPLQLKQIGIAEVDALEQGDLVAVTVRPVGTLPMLWLLLRGAFGRLGEADNVISFNFRRLTVRPAGPTRSRRMKVAMDGEVVWLKAPLEFRVSPEPLLLLKPAKPIGAEA